MSRSRTKTLDGREQRLQRLVDRAAESRHVHSVLLGVETANREISIRAAAGAAHPGDSYAVASITKMFTASIVMQLVDESQLDLHDRVADLLPSLDLNGIHRHGGVDRSSELELHHLLHQTSGLPDYFAGKVEDDMKQNRDRHYSIEDIIGIARSVDAEFPPGDRNGSRSSYSDTNYQLLTAVIEAATGTTYAEAVHQRIAQRLGLEHTWVAGHRSVAPALPLHHQDKRLDLPKTLASERGAGGIISTLDDQLEFMRAYHADQLFDQRHSHQVWNRIFFPVDYGHGLMRYQVPRWMTGFRRTPELIGHSGSSNSFAFYAPELGCHIAGTMNQLDNPARAFRLLVKVAALIRSTQKGA